MNFTKLPYNYNRAILDYKYYYRVDKKIHYAFIELCRVRFCFNWKGK